MSLHKKIYRIVKQIPYGKVISYGSIASIVGCSARHVGYAMAAIPHDLELPWHRVVNAQGAISLRKHGQGDVEQKRLLLNEGVRFKHNGRIDLDRHSWCLDIDVIDDEILAAGDESAK